MPPTTRSDTGQNVCLVLDKRIAVRFDQGRVAEGIVEAQPPENPREKWT